MTFNDLVFKDHPLGMGTQAIIFFPNGYGASVVRFPKSYGDELGLWELAVLKGNKEDWNLNYETSITNDVLGYLNSDEVTDLLAKIESLSKDNSLLYTKILFLLIFLTVLSLIFSSCLGDADDHADLSALSSQDQATYCSARAAWDLACSNDGDNQVFYMTEDNENENRLGLTTFQSATLTEPASWKIYILPGISCKFNVFRHEIGHVLGYSHGDHEFVQDFVFC